MAIVEKTVALSGTREYQFEIALLDLGQPLTIEEDLYKFGSWLVYTEEGECIGKLGPNSWIAEELANGRNVLHASVNYISEPDLNTDLCKVRIRVATGDDGDIFEMPPVLEKKFKVGLVGESHRQEAIMLCRCGDRIELKHEPDNPYDPRAVAAHAPSGMIGYLPRDGWLTSAILDEGKSIKAEVCQKSQIAGRPMGVVVEVWL